MATYINTLTTEQLENLKLIVDSLQNSGITNVNDIAGILAVVSKESAFKPQRESFYYKGSSVDRVRGIFGNRLSSLSDTALQNLINSTDTEAGQKKLACYVYNYSGNDLGNKTCSDAWNYRGRGFNQITGKEKYIRYGKILELDLENNPDLLNNPDTAIKAMKIFFDASAKMFPDLATKYNGKSNEFETIEDATGYYYHHNAGGGKSDSIILKDSTTGRKKAFDRVPEIYEYITENNIAPRSIDTGQKKNTFLYLLFAGFIGYFIYKNYKK